MLKCWALSVWRIASTQTFRTSWYCVLDRVEKMLPWHWKDSPQTFRIGLLKSVSQHPHDSHNPLNSQNTSRLPHQLKHLGAVHVFQWGFVLSKEQKEQTAVWMSQLWRWLVPGWFVPVTWAWRISIGMVQSWSIGKSFHLRPTKTLRSTNSFPKRPPLHHLPQPGSFEYFCTMNIHRRHETAVICCLVTL